MEENVVVIAMIKQKNDAKFAVADSRDIKGGQMTVDDLAALYALPEYLRSEGQIVWVKDANGEGEPAEYRLVGGVLNANWKKTDVPLVNVVVNKIGSISVNTDFPAAGSVSENDLYFIKADVTDDAGAGYTNTGMSFLADSEIIWSNGTWVDLGPNYKNAKDIAYENPTFPALTTVKQALDQLLYVPIQISSLSLAGASVAEKGSVVDDVTINWTLNKSTIASQSLTDADPAPIPEARSYAFTGLGLTSNKTWTLGVDDGQETDAAAVTQKFQNRAYYGSGVFGGATVTEEFVKALSGLAFDNDKKGRTVNYVNGVGEKMWYAYPARFGVLSNVVVDGFSGGFVAHSTIDITNDSGHTESYYVYVSKEIIPDAVTVIFS